MILAKQHFWESYITLENKFFLWKGDFKSGINLNLNLKMGAATLYFCQLQIHFFKSFVQKYRT